MTVPRLNQAQKLEPKTPNYSYKKRPLSRVAIGGSQDTQKSLPRVTASSLPRGRPWYCFWPPVARSRGWFSKEKEKLRLQKEVESKRGIGKPMIGGNFTLVDQENALSHKRT